MKKLKKELIEIKSSMKYQNAEENNKKTSEVRASQRRNMIKLKKNNESCP